jgi:tRNA dimethylallyltransferase
MEVALQCTHGRRAQTGEARAQAAGLFSGDNGAAHYRHSCPYPDSDPLLARPRLENPLTVPDPLLVVVLGPTGSGKTALSLVLAEHFGGEIVNCDSVAMYREFEIGTAKPSAVEQARAPHHLLSFVLPPEFVTAGQYARLARQVLQEIKGRRRLPIVVAGTGLYLRALLEGLFLGPERSEELRQRLRDRARRDGPGYLHKLLGRLDPAAAKKIHANDAPKLIRAIEVCLASRQKMTELWKQGREPLKGFRILRLGLNPDRNALYQRINQRAYRMFESGLVEETAGLVEKYGDRAQALSSLGYRQALQLVRGEIDRARGIAQAQQAHRNYAKRQMTWFRREPEVVWLRGFGDDREVQRAAVAQVEDDLEGARRTTKADPLNGIDNALARDGGE